MENDQLAELIELSIQLERNIARLYVIFHDALPEDAEFWGELYIEEKSHASLIQAARDSFTKRGKFPVALIADSSFELRRANARIEMLIGKYRLTPPTRHEACRVAIALENEAGEIHLAEFMQKEAASTVESVFQRLNRDDTEHARRIHAHGRAIGADL